MANFKKELKSEGANGAFTALIKAEVVTREKPQDSPDAPTISDLKITAIIRNANGQTVDEKESTHMVNPATNKMRNLLNTVEADVQEELDRRANDVENTDATTKAFLAAGYEQES